MATPTTVSTLAADTARTTLQAQIDALLAENAKLKLASVRRVSFKVSAKGGLSVYGMGRFPITLYKEQWLKLLDMDEAIRTFIKDNDSALAVKPIVGAVVKA